MNNDEKKNLPIRWISCPTEEEYLKPNRKAGKQERKRITEKDRSKYKKTDRAKAAKEIKAAPSNLEDLLHGRVLSITPQGFLVESDGQFFNCILRGILKKEKNLLKNLITVGDWVRFEVTSEGEGAIAQIEPRKSVLSRADNITRRKEQLIAANIDQVLITASVVEPALRPSLVDRYIIATLKGNMKPVIVVNKIDLLEENEAEKELYNEFVKTYNALNIPVIGVSVIKEIGLDALKAAMKDKSSVFAGQSGVGKSSLINAMTGLSLRIGKTVEKTGKGSHTTTTAQLIHLQFGGWCIDTPGIKSFGIWDLQKQEIEGYYSEIDAQGAECKFPNCSHTHESDCAVKQAVEQGKISPLRFSSYLSLIEEANEEYKRR